MFQNESTYKSKQFLIYMHMYLVVDLYAHGGHLWYSVGYCLEFRGVITSYLQYEFYSSTLLIVLQCAHCLLCYVANN